MTALADDRDPFIDVMIGDLPDGREARRTMRKRSSRDGTCKVTFELPTEIEGAGAHVCGDFNDWSTTATPLRRRKDGTYAATVALPTGRTYRFRYLLADGEWENDWYADAYVPNEYGGDDSVVEV